RAAMGGEAREDVGPGLAGPHLTRGEFLPFGAARVVGAALGVPGARLVDGRIRAADRHQLRVGLEELILHRLVLRERVPPRVEGRASGLLPGWLLARCV